MASLLSTSTSANMRAMGYGCENDGVHKTFDLTCWLLNV